MKLDRRDHLLAMSIGGFWVALVVSWIVSIAVGWDDVVASHNELGYLVADAALVTPFALLAAHGLATGRRWALLPLLLGLGAVAYAGLHLTVFLIQEDFLSVPAAVYVVLALVWEATIIGLAVREFHRASGGLR